MRTLCSRPSPTYQPPTEHWNRGGDLQRPSTVTCRILYGAAALRTNSSSTHADRSRELHGQGNPCSSQRDAHQCNPPDNFSWHHSNSQPHSRCPQARLDWISPSPLPQTTTSLSGVISMVTSSKETKTVGQLARKGGFCYLCAKISR